MCHRHRPGHHSHSQVRCLQRRPQGLTLVLWERWHRRWEWVSACLRLLALSKVCTTNVCT